MNKHLSAKTLHISSQQKAMTSNTGALSVVGGVGINKNLMVNEDIIANEIIVNMSGKVKKNLYVDGNLYVKGEINKPLSYFTTTQPQVIKITKPNQKIKITRPLVILHVYVSTTISHVISAPQHTTLRVIVHKCAHADEPILKWKISERECIIFEELNDYVDMLLDTVPIFIGGNVKPVRIID